MNETHTHTKKKLQNIGPYYGQDATNALHH